MEHDVHIPVEPPRAPPSLPAGRVRLVDIARRAGVSAAVVSAVLRERAGERGSTTRVGAQTADRVRQVAKELGYRPNTAAQQLRGRRSDLVGVLIGADSTAANFSRLSSVEQAAHAKGRRLMIGQFHGEPGSTRSYLMDFLSRGIEALVCFHNPAPKYDSEALHLFGQFRAVVFQTSRPIEQTCCVDVDRAAGVREAVAHLAARGRRRIALVLNDRPEHDRLMHDRYEGWRHGLADAGLPPAPDLVWHGDGTFPPPPSLVGRAVDFLAQSRADAVVASNDVWAILLMKALPRAGRRVPDDLAVVGFDNLQAAELADPALTTIDQNNPEFAAAAVDLLLAAMAPTPLPPERRIIVVKPRLVVREST